jgi:5-methylcytosine-specific restriction endonuclease McrA
MSAAQKGKFVPEETKVKMSLAQAGHPVSDEARAKQSAVRMGRKESEEWRRHISEAHMGEKSHCWRGGITKEGVRIRNGMDYALWRASVFVRDGYTCQKCGQRGGDLEAHHMDCFADFPEKRMNVDNGVTFCKDCHGELHRRYGMVHNRKWQTDEFLETQEGQEGA